MPDDLRRALIAGVGGALGIAIMVELGVVVGMPLAAVPFATSIVLVMSAPTSPQAQPRNIFGGHLVSAISGFAVLWLLGSAPMLACLAVGLSITLMVLTGTLHPPAGINGLLIVTLAPSWTYLFVPVLFGTLILIAFAWSFHRLTAPERWPKAWW
jgi:CBS-domain-containing membrane protein